MTDRDAFCHAVAKREYAAWRDGGEALVADRQVTRAELDRNLEAWRVIAALFGAGAGVKITTDLTFTDLEAVTAAAMQRRQDAIDHNQVPARHAALVNRGTGVAAVHRRIARNRRAEAALPLRAPATRARAA